MSATAPKRKSRRFRTFVIDRATWLRGDWQHSKLLRRCDGRMCCLGQIALQLGAMRKDILEVSAPIGVAKPLAWNPRSATLSRMMEDNDTDAITSDRTRERRLTKTARRIYWRLKFVGPKEAR